MATLTSHIIQEQWNFLFNSGLSVDCLETLLPTEKIIFCLLLEDILPLCIKILSSVSEAVFGM